LSGGAQYARDHAYEMDKHIVAFESDLGSRTPVAWGFDGGASSSSFIHDLANTYLGPIYNLTNVIDGEGESVDSGWIGDQGVPMIRNIGYDTPDSKYYFMYHHSAGDSMTMMNPE
jgi:carboxypeptidase Q